MADICGSCTMCCKLPGIGKTTLRGEPFSKPMSQWCPHCDIGKGCKVYEDRPEECRIFKCLYYQAVENGGDVDPDLRPDRCGVVLGPSTDGRVIAAFMDPHKPEQWRNRVVLKVIINLIRHNRGRVVLNYGPGTVKTVLFWDKGGMREEKRLFTEVDEHGVQNHIPGPEGTPR